MNRTGDGPPVMAIKADPPSWQVPVLEPLTLDVSDSNDPDGTPVQYSWSVTPSDASLETSGEDLAVAAFPHPGLYTLTATGQDANGASATIQREAMVYGPQGSAVRFSASGAVLEPRERGAAPELHHRPLLLAVGSAGEPWSCRCGMTGRFRWRPHRPRIR